MQITHTYLLCHNVAFLDYEELVAVPLILSTSMNVSCVNISVDTDLAIEHEEMFLILVSTNDEAVNITTNEATVTILDTTTG